MDSPVQYVQYIVCTVCGYEEAKEEEARPIRRSYRIGRLLCSSPIAERGLTYSK